MNANEAIFIFSLGPVQDFIAEARRVGDLDAGSTLLVNLATAAGQAIQDRGGSLIFPARLGEDVSNKLVARVPLNQVETLAQIVQQAIEDEWQKYANKARQCLTANGPAPDDVWEAIWDRQVGSLWETYWAAAPENGDYHAAYDAASRAFDAAKRTRVFDQIEEDGVKDSLSGRRSALRLCNRDAKTYWGQVASSSNITSAELRPWGRERLDATGAIKRWGGLSEGSPSVSHIATADFRAAAKRAPSALASYRQTVVSLLGGYLYPVSNDSDWPYDGDLFFMETLTPERLSDCYGLEQPQPGLLEAARLALSTLHNAVGSSPRPYYAVIALDGDGMGEMVNGCRTEEEHRALSQHIIDFAAQVRGIVEEHRGHTVYAGGDDVLVLSPLSTAFPLAQELAERFRQTVNSTASAGIAIAHHLYPLDVTLAAAREAEHQAKQADKAAVCVRVLKRSGETVDARSPWDAIGGNFGQLVEFFHNKVLSSKLAYAVAEAAYALPHADDSFEAELRRQLHRHRHPDKWTESEDAWATVLRTWAANLPEQMDRSNRCLNSNQEREAEQQPCVTQTEQLGHWLTLARFVAQGGVE